MYVFLMIKWVGFSHHGKTAVSCQEQHQTVQNFLRRAQVPWGLFEEGFCINWIYGTGIHGGKTMPSTSHDWEWFIASTYGEIGDGLLLFY